MQKDIGIGRRLRIARAARNLSKKAVADYLGRTTETIRMYETGRSSLRVDDLVKLQDLGIDKRYILGIVDNPCITLQEEK